MLIIKCLKTKLFLSAWAIMLLVTNHANGEKISIHVAVGTKLQHFVYDTNTNMYAEGDNWLEMDAPVTAMAIDSHGGIHIGRAGQNTLRQIKYNDDTGYIMGGSLNLGAPVTALVVDSRDGIHIGREHVYEIRQLKYNYDTNSYVLGGAVPCGNGGNDEYIQKMIIDSQDGIHTVRANATTVFQQFRYNYGTNSYTVGGSVNLGNPVTVMEIDSQDGIHVGREHVYEIRQLKYNYGTNSYVIGGGVPCGNGGNDEYIQMMVIDSQNGIHSIRNNSAVIQQFIYDYGTNTYSVGANLDIIHTASVMLADPVAGFHINRTGLGVVRQISFDYSTGSYFFNDSEGTIDIKSDVVTMGIDPRPLIAGDITLDGCVDIADLSELASQWLSVNCTAWDWCEGADINTSGETDLSDLSLLSSNFYKCFLLRYYRTHNLGYVTVSSANISDGGDFGPYTSGTTTTGFEESFDFSKIYNRNIHIVGGPSAYFSNPNLYIPPAYNWEVTGGQWILNFPAGDCVFMDSQQGCRIRFGGIIAQSLGTNDTALTMKPQSPLPDSQQKGISNCVFTLGGAQGGGSAWGGVDGVGVGICLDATEGMIAHNRMSLPESCACETFFWLKAGEIVNNWISLGRLLLNNRPLVVDSGKYNRVLDACLNVGGLPSPGAGAAINGGEQNFYRLFFEDGFQPGTCLTFGAEARDNLIIAGNLAANGITNNASVPTNRVVPLQPVGFNIATPAFPASGVDLENRTSYLAVVTIKSAGLATNWTLTDGNGISRTINGNLRAGQLIYLDAGEKIRFAYSIQPSWIWRAVR